MGTALHMRLANYFISESDRLLTHIADSTEKSTTTNPNSTYADFCQKNGSKETKFEP